MITSFEGKVAVVTGAASGIGLALARELAARGAYVSLLDRDPAVHAVAASLGHGTSAYVVDVARRDELRAARDAILAARGAVHLLVNNAGVAVAGRFEDVSDEDLAWLFDINFWGVVHGCRIFLPLLRKEREAHIVNVCSSFAWLGFPGKSAYASSKAAVRALSESLRAELRDTPVGVTLLFPGPVDTNIVRAGRATRPEQREAEARFVAARAVSPVKVAKRCLAGVLADRARVVVSLDYRLLDLAVRLAPSLALAGVAAAAKRMPF